MARAILDVAHDMHRLYRADNSRDPTLTPEFAELTARIGAFLDRADGDGFGDLCQLYHQMRLPHIDIDMVWLFERRNLITTVVACMWYDGDDIVYGDLRRALDIYENQLAGVRALFLSVFWDDFPTRMKIKRQCKATTAMVWRPDMARLAKAVDFQLTRGRRHYVRNEFIYETEAAHQFIEAGQRLAAAYNAFCRRARTPTKLEARIFATYEPLENWMRTRVDRQDTPSEEPEHIFAAAFGELLGTVPFSDFIRDRRTPAAVDVNRESSLTTALRRELARTLSTHALRR
jgi:hypothetical protein